MHSLKFTVTNLLLLLEKDSAPRSYLLEEAYIRLIFLPILFRSYIN
jgi:hypothetical protein